MKWFNSTAFRIWITTNVLILACVTALSATYYWKERAHIENALRSEGLTAANTLNSAIALSVLQEDYSEITPMVYSLLDQPNIQYVIVRDKYGTILSQKGETITKERILTEKVPLEYFNMNLGEIEIALRTSMMDKQLKSLVNSTVLISILFSILAIIVTTIFSKQLSLPLVNLMKASQSMIAGNRKVKVAETGTKETKSLSKAFNEMARKIATNEEHLQSEVLKATQSLSEKIEMLETNSNIARAVMKREIYRDEVLFCILKEIRSFTKEDRISISLFSNSVNKNLVTYILQKDEIIKVNCTLNESSPIYHMLKVEESLVKNKFNKADQPEMKALFQEDGIQSVILIPLMSEDRLVGSLNLGSFCIERFNDHYADKLSVFTSQIVVALDLVSAYESLQYAAHQDFITGLANYRFIKQQIVKCIEQKKTQQDKSLLAILYLDLDRFKKINDSLGHDFGDLMLKEIGKIMASNIDEGSTIARIGGDEFLVLLPSIQDGKVAVETAEKLSNAINRPITIDGYEVHITSSIGIALFPNDGEDAETLIKHADIAFYRIRDIGNNISVYSPIEEDPSYDELVFENDLRKALEREEFSVYYQPKVNIQTGTITGMEALIRWNHPKKGHIPPEKFIPLAEETGLIIPIGQFVLRTACRQVVKWQEAGLPDLMISVNLSTKQFLKSDLLDTVKSILYETGLNPNLLELEITESMTMDIEQAIKILKDLKSLGISISIDDFGTGYSSLNYLNMLPIDRLKIDRSFIQGITENTDNAAIVSTIINIANNLDLMVIAEGVEEERQVAMLQGNNCDEIQGYFFSQPLCAKQFEEKFEEIKNQAEKWARTGKN